MAATPSPPARPEARLAPQRTCIGCRTPRPQSQLVRVVRTGEGTLAVGRTLPGRGAWLCRGSVECLDVAEKRGGFARSFRAPVRSEAVRALRVVLASGEPS